MSAHGSNTLDLHIFTLVSHTQGKGRFEEGNDSKRHFFRASLFPCQLTWWNHTFLILNYSEQNVLVETPSGSIRDLAIEKVLIAPAVS